MNTPIPAQDVRPEPGAISRSCILALDLGTTTGWALRSHDGLITSGTVSFRPGRFDGGGMRYLRFTNWLTELDRLSGPIAAIWFEEVRRHAGTDAAKAILCGAHAVQSVSALLRGGPEHLRAMTTELAAWLDEHGYRNLEEARGATSVGNCANPHELERLNYASLLHSWGAPDSTR